MPISSEGFERLVPLACAWARDQEQLILQRGVRLTKGQLADAKHIGVALPDRVRLMKVEQIPLPQEPELRSAALKTGLLSPDTAGLTVRYGIYIHASFWGVRQLVAHELLHVRQYEQLGGFDAFLRRYLWECVTLGYTQSPMEQEACAMAAMICP